MTPKNLDSYLEDISHYLAVKDGGQEILAEIRSHILEKAEAESGGTTEESIAKVIAAFGRPQDIAAKYMEGQAIISPTFKKHLFLYTGILFAFHFGLTLVALISKQSFVVLPFFYIPRMDSLEALFYLPMTIIYDFGLVGIFLFYLTQKKREAALPWPKALKTARASTEMKSPRIISLILLVLAFGALLYSRIRYGTIFFFSPKLGQPQPLLDPASSGFISSLFVAMLGCETAAYALRFYSRSWWINLAKNAAILLLLTTVWNSPVEPQFHPGAGLDMKSAAVAFVTLLIVLAALDFIKSLAHISRRYLR